MQVLYYKKKKKKQSWDCV